MSDNYSERLSLSDIIDALQSLSGDSEVASVTIHGNGSCLLRTRIHGNEHLDADALAAELGNMLRRTEMIQGTLVMPNDDGFRPAGKPDTCFYCQSSIGEEHKADCVMLRKRVRVRFIYEIEIDAIHSSDEDSINFFYNESSYCADNAIDLIQEFQDQLENDEQCICPYFHAEFIEVVDTTPRHTVRIDL